MEILKGIEIVDLALKIDNFLVISDTHIGYEEAFNKQGVLIPRFQFKEILSRLERIFERAWRNKRVDMFVINGDVKHEFGTISQTEWRHTLGLLDFISKRCKRIVLVKGNHDKIIGPIAERRDVEIVENFVISSRRKKILITHGDKVPDDVKKFDVIIIGHQHPAVSLRDGMRAELYKCFLRGKFRKKDLIVLPAFTPVSEGSDILKGEILTDFLRGNLEDFFVFPVADKVYEFGKIRDLVK